MRLGAWGLAAMAMLSTAATYPGFDIPDVVLTGGDGIVPRHRSSGGRAHRRWRKARSAGRGK